MLGWRRLTQQRGISSAIFLEHYNGKLLTSNRSVISAARKAGSQTSVGILAVDNENSPIISEAQKLPGLSKILVASNSGYSNLLPEAIAPLLASLQKNHNFTHWWGAHSSVGKGVLPRLAGILLSKDISVAPVADIIDVKDERSFTRPIYAGNALIEVTTDANVNIITVRPTAFQDSSPLDGNVTVEKVDDISLPANLSSTWEGEEVSKNDRPDLASAEVVISGGRALKSADNFKLIYELADVLGAGVGASRAAVDAGYVPNELQVGQTGKVVAPKLYIAVGISGAIQHVAGMKDSRTIVAINKDPDCPIFQIADYGLVGDLFTIIPELTQKLKK